MNYLFMVIYIGAVIIIRMQYQKYFDLNGENSGFSEKSLPDLIKETIITGLVAGAAGSAVIIAMGITLEADAIRYLFLCICLLSLLNLRYACISYSAGLLALVSLIFGVPKLNVPSLLGMAAVLQLVESLLVYFLGSRDSIPVFIQHKGEITGAFMIRKFWPVPVAFITVIASSAVHSAPFVRFEWGSLFTPQTFRTAAYALGLDFIAAILCYTDLAVTSTPREKSHQAGSRFFVYSAVLLLLSAASIRIPWLRYVGAVFCIAAHEAIILYGEHREKMGKPLFTPVRRGLKILEVLPGGHAEKMGMQAGDVILSINGKDIQTEEGVREALKEYPVFTWIDLAGGDGMLKTLEYRAYPEGYNALGIVAVPREREVTYNTDYFENLRILRNIVNRFRDINGSV